MTQHYPLDYQDPVHEGFFDPIQELLGAAVPSLRISALNATTLQIDAGTDNDQIAVSINGRYRWRTTDTTAALPGSTPNGTHPVYVTATDNDFSSPEPDPDLLTDYTFGLTIRRTADGPPGTVLYRKVGEVDVLNDAIVAFRQTAGSRPAMGWPVWAQSDHVSQSPLTLKGSSGMTANMLNVDKADGTRVFFIGPDGFATFEDLTVLGNTQLGNAPSDTVNTSGPVTVGTTLTVTGGTSTLSALSVTGAASVGGALTVTGQTNLDGVLDHDGSAIGFFGATPVAQSTGWSVTNVTTDKVINADAMTLHELADVVGTLINYLKTRGDLA